MAYNTKKGLTYFPEWNPLKKTIKAIEIFDRKYCRNYDELVKNQQRVLRNAASSFISRKDVRQYIFTRDGYKCVKCSSTQELSIDHIISVVNCIDGFIHYRKLNSESNLQTLCKSCNSSKKHFYGHTNNKLY